VIDVLSKEFRDDIKTMINLRSEYLRDPTKADIPDKIERIKSPIRGRLRGEFRKLYGSFESNPLFYPLEFFFLYFDGNGDLIKGKRGFSGVIGNPPWNNIKPIKKEFASKHPEIFGENISKFSLSGKEFEKLLDEKLKDDQVNAQWKAYQDYLNSLSDYVKKNYRLQYSGDYSYQKVFLEKFIEKAKEEFAILIPSNFHTDEGSYLLRKEIMENWEIRELISFENRGKKWFSGLHAQYKFDMMIVSSKKTGRPFKARFYVNDEEEIEKSFDYPTSLIENLSPGVLGITEFRSRKDVDIVSKIRGKHKLLKDWKFVLRRELDSDLDNDLFMEKPNGDALVLFEGKMINQYNSNFSTNRYWVDETEGRGRLISKSARRILEELRPDQNGGITLKLGDIEDIVDKIKRREIKLDYEAERLVIRRVGSSTNERSLIATIVPSNVYLMDNLQYVVPFRTEIKGDVIIQTDLRDEIYYLLALLNSYVLDYYIRLRISANLNYFFLYELPIPDANNEIYGKIMTASKKLLEGNDIELRAQLEAIIARDVYKLSKEEMSHILDTFVFGNIDKNLIERIKSLL
jgi:hypothetical protein